mgnify:CR=1 FL=1
MEIQEHEIQGNQIEKAGQGVVNWVQGPQKNSVFQVLPPDHAGPKDLSFVSNSSQLKEALERHVKTLIVHEFCLKETPQLPVDLLLFKTNNIPRAMSVILPLFDDKKLRFEWGSDYHPSSVIHQTAHLGKNVKVGPLAVIGAHVKIGDNSIIGASSVIEISARIGARSLIHSQVFIGARCEIGNDCEVHPHTSIGSDGFGFVSDEKFKHHKIPQLGRVVIEDKVEIGANCAIDRATITETRIRSGTKLDNFCHIAHNCDLGEDSLYAAGFFVAGSSKIGSRFMCGGNVAVTSHVELVDGVILAGRSTVTKDVTEPGQYGGYPLQPVKDALKTIANLSHITEIRKQVQKILKHLQLSDEK